MKLLSYEDRNELPEVSADYLNSAKPVVMGDLQDHDEGDAPSCESANEEVRLDPLVDEIAGLLAAESDSNEDCDDGSPTKIYGVNISIHVNMSTMLILATYGPWDPIAIDSSCNS